ncbi:MAG: GNAT family N-acetyltransferase [Bacteroidetes bacterium B1(2017)]|nr:MAG: GNAT family N-acetyltransferase [Bacteroidetes bacterium B1(2017)]
MSTHSYRVQAELNLQQMLDQFALIQQLNPTIKASNYEEMILEMYPLPYRMLGVFDGEHCIAVCGYWVLTKLYCGKYLELDNVVVDEKYRSKGIGKIMSEHMNQIAIKENCRVMVLDAYIPNQKAHEFYEREGYEKKGYHFVKKVIYP